MNLINLSTILQVIKISGTDSRSFLQGQLTNDINLLTSDVQDGIIPYQFAAHLNHKGRMLANFIILKPATDTYYLITNKELNPGILHRLKMFVLRSKVEINISPLNLILSTTHLNDSLNIRLCDDYFLAITSTHIDTQNNPDIWQQLIIKLGLTLIHTNTQEKLIPQMANLDKLNAISFTKGCYTGQEIVARTHYLGKIKRHLFKFALSYDNISIGQVITSPDMDNQEIGIIVEMQNHDGIVNGLASVQVDCIDNAFIDMHQLLITTLT